MLLRSWGPLGDLGMPFGIPGDPLEVQGPFYMDLGCHSGGLGTPFRDKDRALGHDFSIHALGVVPGCCFNGFMVGQGALEREKPCEFMVLSFKIKYGLKNKKCRFRSHQGSTFHGFGMTLGGIGELLDDLVASLLEACF